MNFPRPPRHSPRHLRPSRYLRPLLLGAALSLSLGSLARAQPDPNNAPKAENPDNRKPPTREERQAQREAQRQRAITRQLERVGLTNKARQKIVLDYIETETQAQNDLQEKSRALATAMRTEAVTDTQVAVLLNDYNVAVDDDRARHQIAQEKLKQSVELLKLPRLEAFLTLAGLYGDAPSTLNRWTGRG